MQKFIIKVLLFFACVVVMDFTFGLFFSYLRTHAKGGSTANCEYIANRATEDIIILGSSRATHHYIPQIIEDSLGMSCYNCGEEGNGVVLAYGRLKVLINRYKPKLIIYELTPSYDFQLAEPNNKYLGYLRPYYDKEVLGNIFDDFDDELNWLKMQSKMYQNTSRLLPDLIDNVIFRNNMKGYSPLYGKLDLDKHPKTNSDSFPIDSMKLAYLEKVIMLAQSDNIPLLFMISPGYGNNTDLSSYDPAISLSKYYNVPLYNFKNYKPISNNASFFQDTGHMNDKGAVEYTKLIVREVLSKMKYGR